MRKLKKVVEAKVLSKNGPLEVIEDQLTKRNYGPKSADRTADFGKIEFFRFFGPYGQFKHYKTITNHFRYTKIH